jgi:hypothetical protein
MPRDHRAARPYWVHSDPEPAPETTAPDATPCVGRCNAAWRAAEQRKADRGTEHTLKPRAGYPIWCPPCATSIRGALGDMPELAVRLHVEISAGASATALDDDLNVTGSRERALHEHEAIVFTLEEAAGFLTDWEDTVRAQRDLPPRTSGHQQSKQAKAVETSSRFLQRHLAWLLDEHPDTAPEGDERLASEGFGLDLLAMHRKAQAMTKTGEVRPEPCEGVFCPSCDLRSLEWEVDPDTNAATGYVRCRVCRPRFVMTADEYHQWTKMEDHDARKRGLATPAVLAKAGLAR